MVRGWGVALLPDLLHRLPETWGRRFCVLVGRAGHRLVGRDRRLARANLARVFNWPEDRIRREARMVFEEIGRNVYDFVRYPRLAEVERDALVDLRGRGHLEAVRREARGAILVTGHLGSWEVLAAHLVREGFPLVALARPLREPRLDRALTAHRLRMGVRTIADDRLLPAVRHLRGGGFLGVLADQRVRRGGVSVDFLGQPTRMTDGPARLALSTGAPLVPVGIHRLRDGRHRITVLPPLPPAPGPEAARTLTQSVADALGSLILEAPRQWMWIHPRWEERPPAPRPAEAAAREPMEGTA